MTNLTPCPALAHAVALTASVVDDCRWRDAGCESVTDGMGHAGGATTATERATVAVFPSASATVKDTVKFPSRANWANPGCGPWRSVIPPFGPTRHWYVNGRFPSGSLAV